MRAAALLVVAAAGLAPESFAAIYTCTDAQGHTVFRDVPCRDAAAADRNPRTKRTALRHRRGACRRAGAGALARAGRAEAAAPGHDQARCQGRRRSAGRGCPGAVGAGAGEGRRASPGSQRLCRLSADGIRPPDYVYERKSERVSLPKRKARATVTRSLREAVLVNGRLQVADVDERLTIEPDGRRLVVRSVRKTAAARGSRAAPPRRRTALGTAGFRARTASPCSSCAGRSTRRARRRRRPSRYPALT